MRDCEAGSVGQVPKSSFRRWRPTSNQKPLKWSLCFAVAAFGLFRASTGHAFHSQSHEAVALEAAAQIQTAFQSGGTGKLVFNANGKHLEVALDVKDVVEAVMHYQSYFLAGALGPDAFPDGITGQWIAHENQTGSLRKAVNAITSRNVENLSIWRPFEQRHSVAQYRAIDFAMDMVQFYNTDYSKRSTTSADEKQQILAFIAGYFSHGVTDGFSHTWINEIVGASWSYDETSRNPDPKNPGMFGSLTEEVQHVAVESMIDRHAPKTAFQADADQGGFGRLDMEAPVRFLDEFYSSTTALAKDIHYNIANDPISFILYFRNLDLFRGGVVSLYFNAQISLMPALRSWSRMGWLFDLAEAVNNNTLVQLLLDLIDIPLEILNPILQYAPQGIDTLTKLATFGYAHCVPMNTVNIYGPDIAFTNGIRDALNFLGGLNDRIAAHVERERVARVNFIRLSECIGESLAKVEAAPYDPTKPGVNTDPCADIVRAGWQDEGNPKGLYRGNIKQIKLPTGEEYMSEDNAEFLMDLKGAFLGDNPDEIYEGIVDSWKGNAPYNVDKAYEYNNDHRSAAKNYQRILTYLRLPGASFEYIKNTIVPSDGKSKPSTMDKLNAICADARDKGFEHCLDLATLPIAATARQWKCQDDFDKCAVSAAKQCAKEACDVACHSATVSFGCDDLCGNAGGCQGWCDDNLCVEEWGVSVCTPIVYQACSGICQIVGGPDSSCVVDAYVVAKCGVKDVLCSWDNIVKTVELEGYGSDILSPVRKVCDVIDDVKAFFACLEGDPNKSDEENKAARHKCVVDACNDVISKAGSNLPAQLKNMNCEDTYTKIEKAYYDMKDLAEDAKAIMKAAMQYPDQFVNVVFFQKDVAKDPGYRDSILQTVASKRRDLVNNPPASTASDAEKQLWQDQIDVLDTISNMANGTPVATNLSPVRLGNALVGLMNQPWPELLGPTAKRILADMGSDFVNTCTPTYNSIQGTKLAPLMSRTDIDKLFTSNNVALSWNLADKDSEQPMYSTICKQPMTSLYCDTLASFDDPNCIGPECSAENANPNPDRNSWVPGRGVVAFNPYDPSAQTQNVLTNFPLAANKDAYDKLYTSIFRLPQYFPGFFGFDDPKAPWTSPTATVTPNTTKSTEGKGSTDISGCNFNDVFSPLFKTTELGMVGTTMMIDVYLPTPSNPYWAGDMQISVNVPGAGIYNTYLNNGNPVPFTGLSVGWNTLTYTVSSNVKTAFLGDYPNAQIMLHINLATCNAPITIDNLRFGGDLSRRQIYHSRASQNYLVSNGAVSGFDNLSDWTTSGSKSAADSFIQGTGALAIPAGGWNPIQSRWFTKAEAGSLSGSLNLDVYIPSPQSNRSWVGDVQLEWECSHFSKITMGPKPLTNGFEGEYNSLRFDLPANLVTFLSSAASTEACRVTVDLNTNPGGTYYLDNMGFIH
jgi:hypothetical protein